MCDNPSDITLQPLFSRVQPLLDLNSELLPEPTASAQCFQNLHISRDCFYRTDPRLAHDLSDSRASVGVIPDNGRIQNATVQWPASEAMGQFPFRESSAPNELTVSYWGEMYMDGLVTEHYPTFMAPTIPQIKLLGVETLRDQNSGVSPRSSSNSIPPRGFSTSPRSTSESPSQAGNQSVSQECYTLWKKVPVDAIIVTGSTRFVPQTLYKPFTETDKERYLEQVSLSLPIIFVTKEPLEWGISLEDAGNGKMQHLVDKNVPVLQNCGPSVSIRINWPGYSPFKCQISSRNCRKMKGPITKQKLAQSVAKITGQFIEKMSSKPLEVDAERSWKVGTQHIKAEDLILVSLHHVSKGSWQPQFRLRRDVAAGWPCPH